MASADFPGGPCWQWPSYSKEPCEGEGVLCGLSLACLGLSRAVWQALGKIRRAVGASVLGAGLEERETACQERAHGLEVIK